MRLGGRVDRLERQRPRQRCDDCITRPASVIRYVNDWRDDRPQPAPEDTALCRTCGWWPQQFVIRYVEDGRNAGRNPR